FCGHAESSSRKTISELRSKMVLNCDWSAARSPVSFTLSIGLLWSPCQWIMNRAKLPYLVQQPPQIDRGVGFPACPAGRQPHKLRLRGLLVSACGEPNRVMQSHIIDWKSRRHPETAHQHVVRRPRADASDRRQHPLCLLKPS